MPKRDVRGILIRTAQLILSVFVAQLVAHGVFWLAGHLYAALHEWFGARLFPLFSPISDAEGYAIYSATLRLISYAISLLVTVYFSLVLSNERCEWVISRTEGFFTLPELYPEYVRRYWLCDLIASVIAPAPFIAVSALIPDEFFDKGYSFILTYQKTLLDTLGLGFGYILSIIVIYALHFLVVFPSLSRFRAVWLTGFAR